MIKEDFDFYKKLINTHVINNKNFEQLISDFITSKLNENLLYKFISFTADYELNNKKLENIRKNLLWFAAHYTLADNDPTEFKINVNPYEIQRKTGWLPNETRNFLELLREMNDLCCLTDRKNEFMWNKYGNNHSGCCCVFEVIKTEMLSPVIYCDKKATDFTNQVVSCIKKSKRDLEDQNLKILAFITPCLKDLKLYGEENEYRLLCGDAYDDPNGPLQGRIAAFKKHMIGYKGSSYSYEKCGLKLKKIIIGKKTPDEIKKQISNLNLDVDIECE